MNTPPDRPPIPPLTEGQRVALLKLLADDDRVVSDVARQRLLDEGPEIGPWLKPHSLSDNPVLRRRTRDILLQFEAKGADARMRAFCRRAGDDVDLEEGAFRLAQTRYPDTLIDGYRAILDDWAGQVREWLPDDRSDADAVLAGIHVVLFQQLRLRGNEENYYDPDNSYLNRVIDRRLGNPISLCAIVLLIGRRLELPLAGIGLPAHFLCRYQTPTREIYLDTFHGGRLLSRSDCIAFVNQLGRPFENGFLHPVSPRRMLQRMCTNLEHAYESLELQPDLARVRHYHELLAGG
ncbi:MAG: transglutaminase family protein [Verrucomicrobiales bacterium]|nr:transglutaminase family protein [Verrucomicrobiales bacterium]